MTFSFREEYLQCYEAIETDCPYSRTTGSAFSSKTPPYWLPQQPPVIRYFPTHGLPVVLLLCILV